jgi:hypothetical protein
MGRKNSQKRGLIQLIITIFLSIYLWVNVPSWEKEILVVIASDPNSLNHFGSYWNNIVLFLLNNWEFISLLILIESLYALILNRNLFDDIIKELNKLLRKIGV